MIPLLHRENHELLAQFAFSHVLLAFDYDGTLAPIVARPEQARMRAETLQLLSRASELYPCAVISGRSERDIRRRLAPVRIEYVLGNHGLEPSARTSAFERQVAQALPRLRLALAELKGVEIEDKSLSLAVHYRRCRRKREAREAIVRAASALPRMRLISGKLVSNIVPRDAPNKGDAVLALRARSGADTALYVGDDMSDEDVFGLDQPGRLLGVRVGRSQRSAAHFYLRDQRQIDSLLRTLVELRAGSARASSGR